MSLQVDWETMAIDQAAGFLRDDPVGVAAVLDAAGRLAGDPRPVGSFPYGSADRRRLRVGRYRAMYDINDTTGVVSIWHLARSPSAD